MLCRECKRPGSWSALCSCVSSPTLIHGLQAFAATKSLQSCPTLCDPIDGSPPGSPVPGILQARTLEYGSLMNGLDGYDAETDFW